MYDCSISFMTKIRVIQTAHSRDLSMHDSWTVDLYLNKLHQKFVWFQIKLLLTC